MLNVDLEMILQIFADAGQIVHDLDADEWVTFAGHVDQAELVGLYRRAWVLTSASVAEGWGMTITEAAACGTPAVVSDIAGHRDALHDGRSGLLRTDDAALAANLTAVLTDATLREQLTAGALERAEAVPRQRPAAVAGGAEALRRRTDAPGEAAEAAADLGHSEQVAAARTRAHAGECQCELEGTRRD